MIPNLEKDSTGISYLKQSGLKTIGFYSGKLDNDWGPKSVKAYADFQASMKPTNFGKLGGDGTWPYRPKLDGEDIVLEDIVITCFGGNGDGTISDPQDNGRSASGKNTRFEPLEGVSIAMDSRLFDGMENRDPSGYQALYGAPFPKIPWGTLVAVTINGVTHTPKDGIIDLGPGRRASKPGEPHACDLTPLAARLFQAGGSLNTLSRNFEARGSMRILGGAKFVAA